MILEYDTVCDTVSRMIKCRQSGSDIPVFGGGDGVELGRKGFVVGVLGEGVLAALHGALGLGLQDHLGRAEGVGLADEVVLVYGF